MTTRLRPPLNWYARLERDTYWRLAATGGGAGIVVASLLDVWVFHTPLIAQAVMAVISLVCFEMLLAVCCLYVWEWKI